MEPEQKTSIIHKHLPTLEKLFLLSLAVGLTLNFLNMDLPQITLISLTGLGVVFFMNTYRSLDIPGPEEGKLYGFQELLSYTIIPKVLWISTSILTVGILFYMMNTGNNGYLSMIGIGSTTVIIGTVFLIGSMVMGTKHLNLVIPVLYRSTPALVVGIYIYLQSNPELLG